MIRVKRSLLALATACFALFAAVAVWASGKSPPGNITQDRALHADAEPGNWLLHGRTFSEQFFSPLRAINQNNVGRLGVAWYSDVDSPAGLVGQPLMADGVIYFTGMYSTVTALSASDGKTLWQFTPPDLRFSQSAGNNPLAIWNMGTNRGLALWEGNAYVASGDCRLFAINAKTGASVWQTQVCDPGKGYAISGAPRVAAGKIFIGTSGSDGGARGMITAYDAKSGKQIWRFYTVPAKVDGKFESEFMALVAKTWDEGKWEGGGATVWDGITYDPDFNRLYFGTSCVGPLDARERNPGGGDQLFTCAIVAVDADTGKYVWHYSVNPNYKWDYDAVMQLTLADLTIDGKPRKVLMQAPKNGFLFVIDRETGRFISAKNYAKVNWAKGFDENGRPIFSEDAEYWKKPNGEAEVFPGDVGSHSVQPMSFSPETGLVYIPTCDFGSTFRTSPSGAVFGGVELTIMQYKRGAANTPKQLGRLVAWNPVTQSLKWEHPYPTPCNGGVLSTAGGLVFQGDNDGGVRAFNAGTGKVLWSTQFYSGVVSAPITYTFKGEQYVLFLAGFGGQGRSLYPDFGSAGPSRVIALKLGAKAHIPSFTPEPLPKPVVADAASPQQVAFGEHVYRTQWCSMCHGVQAKIPAGGSAYPDLRRMSKESYDEWENIVLGGSLSEAGMFSFADLLDKKQALAIRDYVIHRAWTDYNDQENERQLNSLQKR